MAQINEKRPPQEPNSWDLGWRGFWRNPEYVFSGCVAVFTIALSVISFLQWRVMQEQLDQLKLDQRAWISSKKINVRSFQQGAPIRVDYIFTNTGKTPALAAKYTTALFFRANDARIAPNLGSKLIPHAVIAPGAVSYEILTTEDSTSVEAFDSINSGKLILYIAGKIEYRDVFREPHFTEFCGVYNPKQGVFLSCEEHQDAN